jgi:hypothetical protein
MSIELDYGVGCYGFSMLTDSVGSLKVFDFWLFPLMFL